MRTFRLPLLLACLAHFAFIATCSARTAFSVYGGKGDAETQDECPAGSFFTGLVGNTGAWIDQISVVCGKAPGDGSVSGSKSLSSRGGTGGVLNSVLCGKNEAVDAIDAQHTPGYQILAVTIWCQNLQTHQRRNLFFAGNGKFEHWGPGQQCPAGELATGLTIRYGQHVNAVGLICNTYQVRKPAAPPPVVNAPPPPAPPPPPANQDPPENPAPPAEVFVTVLKDVDVYSASGGNDADKTGEILSAGTPNVKLLQKKAQWFHLQWEGHDGWVYSGAGYVSLKLP